ncbi:hypothetical protein LY76DRAFT_299946 [Colletotrichum caudatum]|nr:hypothetical protein LY76DRAFT_299946 [Colletotrichum caudatum]
MGGAAHCVECWIRQAYFAKCFPCGYNAGSCVSVVSGWERRLSFGGAGDKRRRRPRRVFQGLPGSAEADSGARLYNQTVCLSWIAVSWFSVRR